MKKIKTKTWIIVGVVVVILIVVLIAAVGRHANGSSRIIYTQVEMGDIENTTSSTGTLSAKGTVEVGTQVSGNVDKVYVDFNDKVHKGQVLAVLDTLTLAASVHDAEANLVKAQAQYELSSTKYQNAKELYDSNLISEIDFKTAKTNHEVDSASLLSAQASAVRAQINLKYAVIRSPINGTVINRNIEPGQTVAASFSTPTLFVIAEDLSQMEILAYVDESDIGQIKKGQSVRFTVDAYPEDTFYGTAQQIRLQPETIQNVVNYTVVADAANDRGLLLPGMTATIDFIIEQRQNVLLISNAALQFQPPQDMLVDFRKNPRQDTDALPDSLKQKMKAAMAHGKQAVSGTQFKAERPESTAVLWYFDDKHKLSMLRVRTGITDGRNTELIDSHGIKEGMKFISGITRKGAAVNNSETGQNQQTRVPRGPRLF